MSAPPTPIVIAGAGKLGKLLFDCLDGDERWQVVGFIDDALAGGCCFDLPIYASDTYDPQVTRNAFMAVGYPQMRRAMVERLAPLGLDWRTFIDRRSMVGRNAALGRGVLVLSYAMIASGVRMGSFTYLSSYAHVGTGSAVGDYSSIMAGVSIGETVIGKDCVLGLRSACLEGAIIGDGATVAPFTLVRKPIPAGALVAGSPARIVRRGGGPIQEARRSGSIEHLQANAQRVGTGSGPE